MAVTAGCGGQGEDGQRKAAAARQHVALKKKAAPPARPAAPPAMRRLDCARLKCVALTYDDGPGAYTGQLLDMLRRSGARATFFMLGENVRGHAHLVRRMAYEGHELANHTWSHPKLTGMSGGAVRSEISRTQRAIQEASGVVPKVFRPPYGATDAQVGRAVGMPQIMWSVDSMDWLHRNMARNVSAGVKQPKPGGVVLFHDIHQATVKATPSILSGLRQRGFTLVTVSELFQARTLRAGSRYTELW
ncbi:polysaccharide deacetylase family protein [Actinomadura rugatobispora]|uniref:Polysaccharide deacetylase family protein n=1 Tax=Actinomadura rugatobispora TaxID=1994 RepID=A0ABW1A7B4_9ACTN